MIITSEGKGNRKASILTDPLQIFETISRYRQSEQRSDLLGNSITFLLRASAKVKVTVRRSSGQFGSIGKKTNESVDKLGIDPIRKRPLSVFGTLTGDRREKLTSFASVIRSFVVDGFRRFVSGSEVPVVDYAGKKTVSSARQHKRSDTASLLAIHGFPP